MDGCVELWNFTVGCFVVVEDWFFGFARSLWGCRREFTNYTGWEDTELVAVHNGRTCARVDVDWNRIEPSLKLRRQQLPKLPVGDRWQSTVMLTTGCLRSLVPPTMPCMCMYLRSMPLHSTGVYIIGLCHVQIVYFPTAINHYDFP